MLIQFLQAAKDGQHLEREGGRGPAAGGRPGAAGAAGRGGRGEEVEGIQVVVGVTMYPGNLEKKVRDRTGRQTTLGAIEGELAEQVAHYLSLY
ncbi:MAG: hypothetical protein FJY95_20685 [Candidatus Handelsmanbacteria bacterium]|nr:hypothetical protein [Candidatus Handelsmanbacteria bacterium]